jgi:hypothetical protein
MTHYQVHWLLKHMPSIMGSSFANIDATRIISMLIFYFTKI